VRHWIRNRILYVHKIFFLKKPCDCECVAVWEREKMAGFAVHGSVNCGDTGYFSGAFCACGRGKRWLDSWTVVTPATFLGRFVLCVCVCVEGEVSVGPTNGSNDFFPVSGLYVHVMWWHVASAWLSVKCTRISECVDGIWGWLIPEYSVRVQCGFCPLHIKGE
jgi:hypothetical protein